MALALRMTLLLLALPGTALAQPGETELEARRGRVVAEAAKGPAFRSSGQDYRVVSGVRASETARDASPGSRLAEAGVAEEDLLEVKGRYAIHLERAGSRGGGGAATFAVAVNTRSGALGVVTGTVTGRVGTAAEAEAAARAAGLRLDFFAESTGYAFFQVRAGGDPFGAAARLRARAGMKDVEVEVRERHNRPE